MDFSKDISDMAGGNAGPEFSLVLSGGPFVWLLLAIGFIGLLIIVERVIYLHRGQIRAMAFVEGVCANLRNGRFLEALTVCEESPGPVPRVVKVILLHAKEGEARMRIAAEEAALLEIPVLERRAGTIRALAKIAPLVGLATTRAPTRSRETSLRRSPRRASGCASPPFSISATISSAGASVRSARTSSVPPWR